MAQHQSATVTGHIPVACSLTETEVSERFGEWRALLKNALVRRERAADGYRLYLDAARTTVALVKDLARREQACCPFFTFAVNARGGEIHLNAASTAEALPLLDTLLGSEGHGPKGT